MGNLIGNRIKALRKERGWSQHEVARMLGFKDRQTVSAIETGFRRVTVEELVRATEQMGVSLEYFTDPFRLEGDEALFSWRRSSVPLESIEEYERKAGRWIAAYRALSKKVGRTGPLMRQSLGLTRYSSYEDAEEAGERFSDEFELGDVPALRLAEAMEKELGILVLMVEANEGISGAACRLPDLDAVLIARGEVEGRRHFDLAHELFHILTWDAMPPERVEDVKETGGKRVEQLANCFASALLMPGRLVKEARPWERLDSDLLIEGLNSVASEFKVTSSALRWRLVTLGELSATSAQDIPEAALRNNGGREAGPPPPLLSQSFAEVLAMALEQGHISARRAASLLEMGVEELSAMFAAHGVECDIGL